MPGERSCLRVWEPGGSYGDWPPERAEKRKGQVQNEDIKT